MCTGGLNYLATVCRIATDVERLVFGLDINCIARIFSIDVNLSIQRLGDKSPFFKGSKLPLPRDAIIDFHTGD